MASIEASHCCSTDATGDASRCTRDPCEGDVKKQCCIFPLYYLTPIPRGALVQTSTYVGSNRNIQRDAVLYRQLHAVQLLLCGKPSFCQSFPEQRYARN